jgi:hypothetical protein
MFALLNAVWYAPTQPYLNCPQSSDEIGQVELINGDTNAINYLFL